MSFAPKFFRPLLLLAPLLLAPSAIAQGSDQAAEDKLTLEIIKRLDGFDMTTAAPKVKESVSRYLAANKGSKGYFEFIERFNVLGEKDHLLEIATTQAGKESAADACKTLVKLGCADALKERVLSAEPGKAGPLLDALSLSQSREAAKVIISTLTDAKATPELKHTAVRSLGKSRNGENVLLDAVKAGNFPASLHVVAAEVLHGSRDANIRREAETLLPKPMTQGNKPLPPVAELLKRKGDPTKGQDVYQRACLICHKIGDTGIEFGPALTEIGGKLAKEALYQSILDPNAGISFGFEGFEVKTKKGDIYVGMVAGETDAELTLRVQGGVLIKTPKSEVQSKTKLEASLMPPNLTAAMTEEELVDLVEYLGTLKKK